MDDEATVLEDFARGCVLTTPHLEVASGFMICSAMKWSSADLVELIGWGAPVLRIGSAESADGWAFVTLHLSRFVSLIAAATKVPMGPGLPAGLRALRERVGLPLVVPTHLEE